MITDEFRSEADLVEAARHLVEEMTNRMAHALEARTEVAAPGGVPDLVMFVRTAQEVRYVVTIEFKLRNWRRALRQAFRNRNFGNESYVVLDHMQASSALRHLSDFREANVGLATIDTAGNLRMWNLPTPSLPFSTTFARSVAEALIADGQCGGRPPAFSRSLRGGVVIAELRQALSVVDEPDC